MYGANTFFYMPEVAMVAVISIAILVIYLFFQVPRSKRDLTPPPDYYVDKSCYWTPDDRSNTEQD